jgi:hypothetical protein
LAEHSLLFKIPFFISESDHKCLVFYFNESALRFYVGLFYLKAFFLGYSFIQHLQ